MKRERRKPALLTVSACCTPDSFLTFPGQFQVSRERQALRGEGVGVGWSASTSLILAGWLTVVSASECSGAGDWASSSFASSFGIKPDCP